jgi:hypothetical protein
MMMNRHKFSLLLAISTSLVTNLATGLPASAELSSGDVNLIGIGAGLITNLLNPPHRTAEINAELELKKAKLAADVEIEREKLRIAAAADKVSPILNKWGVARASCEPGAVFINGIEANANTICVKPSKEITPGYYTYNQEKGVLLRTSSTTAPTTPSVPAPSVPAPSVPAPAKVTEDVNITQKGF